MKGVMAKFQGPDLSHPLETKYDLSFSTVAYNMVSTCIGYHIHHCTSLPLMTRKVFLGGVYYTSIDTVSCHYLTVTELMRISRLNNLSFLPIICHVLLFESLYISFGLAQMQQQIHMPSRF